MIQKFWETYINADSLEHPFPMKLTPLSAECEQDLEMRFVDDDGKAWIQVHHRRAFPVMGYISELWDIATSSIFTEPRKAAQRRLDRLKNPLTMFSELRAIRQEQSIRKSYNGGDGVLKIETPDGPVEIAIGGVNPKNKMYVSINQDWGKIIVSERICNLQGEVLNEYNSTVEWIEAWGIYGLVPRDSVDNLRMSVGIKWPLRLRLRHLWVRFKQEFRLFFRIRSNGKDK